MELSKVNQTILLAITKGYTIDKEGILYNKKGKEVKGYIVNGYKKFAVKGIKTRKSREVPFHKFQAYTKFGTKMFELGIQVRHINGISTDNSWGNIEIGTQSQNMMDRPKEVRVLLAKNAASFLRALTEDQIREFRKDRAEGFTYKQLMEKYKVCKATVSYIVNRKVYKDVI